MPNKELGIADPIYDALRIHSGQSIAPDLGGGSFGAGGLENKIYVWHADGSTLDLFDPDAAGLDLALAAAASSDAVFIPATTITGDHTIPASVGVVAIQRRAAILTGEITLSASSSLQGLTIARTANSGSDLIAVLGPASGAAYLYDCDVSALQAGAGNGYAISAQAGDVYHRFCVFIATSNNIDSNPFLGQIVTTYSAGAEISTGAITVTSATGATISGLTIGQWYAVEAFNGPWQRRAGWDSWDYRVSNNGGTTWLPAYPGYLGRTNDGIMHLDIPAWGAASEIVATDYARLYFQATTTSIKIRVGEDLQWADNTGTLSWRLRSATQDVTTTGGIYAYASETENDAGARASFPRRGDRAAYNTDDSTHAARHASDISDGTYTYHKNPGGGGSGGLGSCIFVASENGAALDTSLTSGGGTDDTAALQSILNLAPALGRLLLIVDGPALVSGLDVYSNTTIYCLEGGGFYLKDGSNREVVRNGNRSRTTITDEHIALIGGYYNANHSGQTGSGGGGHSQSDGTMMNGVSMFGVNYLEIRGVTVINPMGFAVNVGNASYVTLHDLRLDAGSSPHINQDGIHLNGPVAYSYISNSKIYSYDDAIAINAGDDTALDLTINNEHGPYVGQGLISNCIIDGVEFVGCLRGFRLLSHDSNSRIDQLHISNVTGSVAWTGLFCNPEIGNGDIGLVTIDGWDVRQLTDAHSDRSTMYWNGNIERLLLTNIEIHKPIDTRTLIFFHPNFVGQSVTIDGLHIYDSSGNTIRPINVAGHIVRFDGSNISMVRGGSACTALFWLDNAASRIEYVTLDGVIVDNVNFVFSQTAGTVPTTILASNINHLVPATNATFSTTGGTITDVCISNWYGYTPFSGTATTKRGDAMLTSGHLFVGNALNTPADVALSNDATISNTGALTLATVNSNVGSFSNANITVNAKGLITAAASGSGGGQVIGLARWAASANQTTFDLPDTAEQLNRASDNGSIVDPATVTLATSNTQMVFNTGITAGHIVTAEYVMAQV